MNRAASTLDDPKQSIIVESSATTIPMTFFPQKLHNYSNFQFDISNNNDGRTTADSDSNVSFNTSPVGLNEQPIAPPFYQRRSRSRARIQVSPCWKSAEFMPGEDVLFSVIDAPLSTTSTSISTAALRTKKQNRSKTLQLPRRPQPLPGNKTDSSYLLKTLLSDFLSDVQQGASLPSSERSTITVAHDTQGSASSTANVESCRRSRRHGPSPLDNNDVDIDGSEHDHRKEAVLHHGRKS
ncbi:hypothetical protein BG004_003922, partial [Podila humilis]